MLKLKKNHYAQRLTISCMYIIKKISRMKYSHKTTKNNHFVTISMTNTTSTSQLFCSIYVFDNIKRMYYDYELKLSTLKMSSHKTTGDPLGKKYYASEP